MRRPKQIFSVAIRICAAIFIACLSSAFPAVASTHPGKDTPILEVVVMDVGQGDGIYIRTPGGKTILIDAGPDARRGVLPFLRSRNVTSIDAIVMTHPHQDHIGGVRAVMNEFPVRQILDSGKEHTSPEYRRILEAVRQMNIPYAQPRAGERLNWDEALDVRVFHPDRADYDNVNDNSIIIRVAYRDISFLFTGDAERDAEEVAAEKFGGAMKSNVLKVGHHGSRTSTHPDFLDAVRPEFALISCGKGNSFGHPRPETLEHLSAADARVLRTDEDGFLMFKTDGKKIWWSRSPVPFVRTNVPAMQKIEWTSPRWSGPGIFDQGTIILRADPSPDEWISPVPAVRGISIPTVADWSCEVTLPNTDGRGEFGLAISVDSGNGVFYGIQDGRFLNLSVRKKGQNKIGPERLAAAPHRIGLRHSDTGLEALLYDEPRKTWRTAWTIRRRDLPAFTPSARLGIFSIARSGRPQDASFRDFHMTPAASK